MEDYSLAGNRLRALMEYEEFPDALHYALHGENMLRTGLDGELYRRYHQRPALVPERFGGIDRLGDLIITPGSGMCWHFANDSEDTKPGPSPDRLRN